MIARGSPNWNLIFGNPGKGKFSLSQLEEWINSDRTKRLCFGIENQSKPFHRNGDNQWWLNLPFDDTVEDALRQLCPEGFPLLQKHQSSEGRIWYSALISDSQKIALEKTIDCLREPAFLRDLLSHSMAMGMNMNSDGSYTDLGKLEFTCKYRENEEAKEILGNRLLDFIQRFDFYRTCDAVCCVPSDRKVMWTFADLISARLGMENLSDFMVREPGKREVDGNNSIKNADSSQEKLYICNSRPITITAHEKFADKKILLIDDLYQSGISMNYAAMHILEAGAIAVNGLSIVKALRN